MQRINNKGSRSVPVLPVLYQINRAPALAAALRQAPGLTKSLCIKGNLPIYSMYSLYGFCTIFKTAARNPRRALDFRFPAVYSKANIPQKR